jgi:hypothetical protein
MAPVCSIDLSIQQDGHLGPKARIFAEGATHLEPFTEDPLAPGEKFHGWLSKSDVNNRVELVIYDQATPQGNSKITNHQVPFGRDIWGTCKSTF